MPIIFEDRLDAGQRLAQQLIEYQGQNVALFTLPRGGVVVGAAIAKALKIPLGIIIARKIGHPLQPEFGIAAVSEGGHLAENEKYLATVDENWFAVEKERQQNQAIRQKNLYRPFAPNIPTEGKTAILVDDGVATGLTTIAALRDLADQNPQAIILAIPVIPLDTAEKIKPLVNKLVALAVEKDFLGSVGTYYERFPQIIDDEVINLLKQVNQKKPDGNS